MAILHIDNVPDSLYERLQQHARRNGRSVDGIVVDAVENELCDNSYLAPEEWKERLAQRSKTDIEIDTEELLRETWSVG